jgi:hypothetical protein
MKIIKKTNNIEIHPDGEAEQLFLEDLFFNNYARPIAVFGKDNMVDKVVITSEEDDNRRD